MNTNLKTSLESINSFTTNFFDDFCIGDINQKYHEECYKLIEAFLNFFQIKSVKQNSEDDRLNNTKYTIEYNEPLYVTNRNQKIPQEVEKVFTMNEKALTALSNFLNTLKKHNINGWNEQVKLIPHKNHILFETQNLKACLLVDLIYEIIILSKDKSLFGQKHKKDIAHNILNAFSYFKFSLKNPALKKFLSAKQTHEHIYYHGYLSTLIKNSQMQFESEALPLQYPKPNTTDLRQIVIQYYAEILNYKFNPPENLLKLAASKDNRDIKKDAKKANTLINEEYLLLYEQMGYLYFSDWLNKYFNSRNELKYLLNCQQTSLENGKIIFINTTTFSKQSYCNPTKNITENSVLNPEKLYPRSNIHGNISVNERRISQYMLFSYYNYCLEKFLKKLKLFFYSDQNVKEFLLETFRINYLLRNSIFFKIFHKNLMDKLNITKNLNIKNIQPSFYTTTLLLYLNKTPFQLNETEVLDKLNEYFQYIAFQPTDCTYDNIFNIAECLSIKNSELQFYPIPEYLIKELQKYIQQFLNSNINDSIWDTFDKDLKSYYNSLSL